MKCSIPLVSSCIPVDLQSYKDLFQLYSIHVHLLQVSFWYHADLIHLAGFVVLAGRDGAKKGTVDSFKASQLLKRWAHLLLAPSQIDKVSKTHSWRPTYLQILFQPYLLTTAPSNQRAFNQAAQTGLVVREVWFWKLLWFGMEPKEIQLVARFSHYYTGQ